ncbi:unnamed protein product [Rangifer tarandus platyrhynchus]|uniref:Uncharacterized protein n=1 Tax=Rangifer tarandus platyrhynchus TaxID=3082113 RepID=A0AC60A4K5_RANTA
MAEQAEPRHLVSLSLESEVQGLVSCFGRMGRDLSTPGVRTLPSSPDRSGCQSPPRTPPSGHDTLTEGKTSLVGETLAFPGNQRLWVPERTEQCAPKDISSSNPTCECGFIWNWGFCRCNSIKALDSEWTPNPSWFLGWGGVEGSSVPGRSLVWSSRTRAERERRGPLLPVGSPEGWWWQGQQVMLVLELLPAEWHGQDLLPRLAKLVQSIRLISDELEQSLNLSDSLD